MSLQHILLGLLNDEPGSGYDLNKRLEVQGRHFWNTDQSQIYRALYRMEDNGWVKHTIVSQEKSPNKKVYHITKNGEQELKRWLTDSFEPIVPQYTWLAHLYFGYLVQPETIRERLISQLEYVRSFRQWVTSNLQQLKQSNDVSHPDYLRALTFNYQLESLSQEMDWLQKVIAEIDGSLDT